MTKYIIRDDIISVDTYYQAEVYYRQHLEQLYCAGYYCFQAQWARLHKNPKILRGMRDAGLVTIDAWSARHNVVRLTQTALKYLIYRDVPEEQLAGKTKDQIPIRTIAVRPNNGPLLASAMRYELIVKHSKGGDPERFLRGHVLQYIDDIYNAKVERQPGVAEYLEDDYKKLTKLILSLHDSTKVLVYRGRETINAVILDVSHRDPASYDTQLYRLESLLQRVCNISSIKRAVTTVSEERAKQFDERYTRFLIPELAPVYAGKVTTDKWIKPRDRKIATAIADRIKL